MEHNVKVEQTSERDREGPPQRVRFQGVCSCGDRSDVCIAAGMVHSWDIRHREFMSTNRFPELTSKLAIQAATLRLARKSKRGTGSGLLTMGTKTADALRDLIAMEGTRATDPEQLALDLWEEATGMGAVPPRFDQ